MIGREAEIARVEALLADARGGRSGALLVVGEPGIGTTALLERARVRAHEVGMTRVGTTGAEAEARLAFAGLADLLSPLLEHLDAGARHHPNFAVVARMGAGRPGRPGPSVGCGRRGALMVADGATSAKAVGYHLGRVHGKLGVRSRGGLAARLSAGEPGG